MQWQLLELTTFLAMVNFNQNYEKFKCNKAFARPGILPIQCEYFSIHTYV